MRALLSGLTARLVLAMAGVALVSALLAGLLVAPLVDSAAEDAVREPLGRQATFLAQVSGSFGPGMGSSSGSSGSSSGYGPLGRRSGLEFGRVEADGTTSGIADGLTAAEVDALLAGRPVSTRISGSDDLVVEARPTPDGGALVLGTDAGVVADATGTLLRRLLLALGIGLVAALAVAWALASRLGRPLTRTAAAARRLAAGERGVDLPHSTTTEVADVTSALASLDAALATSEGRQREFLLSVSHELRTPLTAVRGYAEALADGLVTPEETPDVARTMVAETDRVERYVRDLLALARLQADDFALAPVEVDVAALLATAAEAWRARGERAGVRVSGPVDAAAPVLATTDPERLRQVVDALVDNAVRVCGPGDVVVLAVARIDDGAEGRGVRVEVRDSGPGLTADDAAVAFEPGVLHDRYAGLRPGGHGLGLAIVHRLVTRLGGRIVVREAAEGGTAFVVDLP